MPEWSGRTYDVPAALVAEGRPEVRMVPGIEASRAPIDRPCAQDELPSGFRSGWRYRAPVIDMPLYLRYLEDRLTRAGGTVTLGRLETLDEALALASVVVN